MASASLKKIITLVGFKSFICDKVLAIISHDFCYSGTIRMPKMSVLDLWGFEMNVCEHPKAQLKWLKICPLEAGACQGASSTRRGRAPCPKITPSPDQKKKWMCVRCWCAQCCDLHWRNCSKRGHGFHYEEGVTGSGNCCDWLRLWGLW